MNFEVLPLLKSTKVVIPTDCGHLYGVKIGSSHFNSAKRKDCAKKIVACIRKQDIKGTMIPRLNIIDTTSEWLKQGNSGYPRLPRRLCPSPGDLARCRPVTPPELDTEDD